jgi:hypothetical protein
MDALVMKLLASDPEDRYASATQLIEPVGLSRISYREPALPNVLTRGLPLPA